MVSTALQSSSTWQTNYSSSTFKEAVSYDANGNILTYKRQNHTGQTLDDLSYIYDNAGLTHKTNRLLAVNDAAAGSADFAEDVEGSNQYYYDQIGNITKINENGRSKDIAWNVYGKVRSVTMNTAQLTFGYDAQQNRFKKRVQKDGKTDINYYLRDAQGNTLAIYSKTERSEGTFFFWDEQHLYGSARLGIETTTLSMRGAVTNDPLSNEVLQAYAKYGNQWRDVLKKRYDAVGRYIDQVFMDTWGESWEYRLNRLLDRGDEDYLLQQTQNETYTITVGNKQYELSNHLGNVLAVVSDKKLFIDNKWQATVLSAQDYYPFGMSMPNRKWQGTEGGSYRFSFNGKEDDTEWGVQDYGMRIYDKSIAKFLSVDPLTEEYPELTPYQFASNMPIMAIDLDGLEASQAIGGSISISTTIGTTNKNLSAGFNLSYARSTSNISSEYTFGISTSTFNKVNNFKATGIGITVTGSALFGSGQNTSLLGSGIISPINLFNPVGANSFNGGGIGFSSIQYKGTSNVNRLSNFNLHALGRFSIGQGSLNINIMEDYPFSDKGSTGTLSANFIKPIGTNQTFSIGCSNETYTAEATQKSKNLEPSKFSDPHRNIVKGYKAFTKYSNKAPSYGVNSFNIGLHSNYYSADAKRGLYGGKQGAAFQNFVHKYGVTTPLFQHNTSYFGKPFWEVRGQIGIRSARDLTQ